MVTVAPGRIAPDASFTIPAMLPYTACAAACETGAAPNHAHSAMATRIPRVILGEEQNTEVIGSLRSSPAAWRAALEPVVSPLGHSARMLAPIRISSTGKNRCPIDLLDADM